MARVDECVTMDCAGKAVAEFRWYETGRQVGHYCESCLATMERHHGSDEGSRTTRYEPAPTAPFTDEDREELEMLADDWDLIARAASYITHLEGALEAADERLRIALTHPTPDRNLARAVESARAELARAALPTSKEDAG